MLSIYASCLGPKGDRRLSRDSGRYSLTPSVDGVEVDYSHYPRVSVDRDRKEELALAKEVRRSRRGRTSSKSLAERNFGARGDYARRRH